MSRRIGLAWLDAAIVVSGVLATAGAGLVVEDALPLKDGRTFDPTRWVWTIVWTIGLVRLVNARRRRARTTGTLYYLRYLQEWMSDWHLDDLHRAKGSYLDRRVVGRWSTAVPEGVTLDLAAEVATVTSELQRSMNDDRADTGFNLAPNLILPVGVAVGFDLYEWDGVQLEELFGGQTLSWPLSDLSRRLGFDVPDCTVEKLDTSAQAVVVTVDLTGVGETTMPPGVYAKHYRVGVFADDDKGVSRSRPVTVATAAPPAVATHTPPPPRPTDQAVVHPQDATRTTVAAIRCALHENPGRAVVVAARVPKTVAVGIGWQLANGATREQPGCGHAGCTQAACRHPWTNLIVLQLNQDNHLGPYLFPRVHVGQPPLPELLDRVGLERGA